MLWPNSNGNNTNYETYTYYIQDGHELLSHTPFGPRLLVVREIRVDEAHATIKGGLGERKEERKRKRK
jgi:hypothetical protein